MHVGLLVPLEVVVLVLLLEAQCLAATSPISAPQSSWVLDSGASFHVTSDQSQLVARKPVADGASIQSADGTSCYITHQGSFCTSNFYVPDVSFTL